MQLLTTNPLFQPKTAVLKIAPLSDMGRQRFEMAHNTVLEELPIGDYELYLVQDGYFGFVQIGLQRRGQDFTDMEQQAQRIIPRNWGNFDRKGFKAAIQRWLSEHHLIVIGSHNPVKTKLFSLALRSIGFRLKTTDTGHLSYIDDGQADPRKVQAITRAAEFIQQYEQQGGDVNQQVEQRFRGGEENEPQEQPEQGDGECTRCYGSGVDPEDDAECRSCGGSGSL